MERNLGNSKSKAFINKLVLCGVFTALAYVCVCVFRIKVSFLTLDIKDALIATAAMLLGPIAGMVISLLVSLIEMLTISDTLYYGFIMNFLSSASFSVVASLIYRSRKNLVYAVIGLVTAIFSVTAVMMLANLLITPHFMVGATTKDVIALIPKLLLPFNFVKAVLNAALVMLIYKPISATLVRAKIIKKERKAETSGYKFGVKTIGVTLVSAAILAICFVIIFVVLNGSLS